jgi:hypothetical protein
LRWQGLCLCLHHTVMLVLDSTLPTCTYPWREREGNMREKKKMGRTSQIALLGKRPPPQGPRGCKYQVQKNVRWMLQVQYSTVPVWMDGWMGIVGFQERTQPYRMLLLMSWHSRVDGGGSNLIELIILHPSLPTLVTPVEKTAHAKKTVLSLPSPSLSSSHSSPK